MQFRSKENDHSNKKSLMNVSFNKRAQRALERSPETDLGGLNLKAIVLKCKKFLRFDLVIF